MKPTTTVIACRSLRLPLPFPPALRRRPADTDMAGIHSLAAPFRKAVASLRKTVAPLPKPAGQPRRTGAARLRRRVVVAAFAAAYLAIAGLRGGRFGLLLGALLLIGAALLAIGAAISRRLGRRRIASPPTRSRSPATVLLGIVLAGGLGYGALAIDRFARDRAPLIADDRHVVVIIADGASLLQARRLFLDGLKESDGRGGRARIDGGAGTIRIPGLPE